MKNQNSTTIHYPQKSNQNLYTGKGWRIDFPPVFLSYELLYLVNLISDGMC